MNKLFSIFIVFLFWQINSFAQSVLVSDMPTARIGHCSCVLGSKIYVLGGSTTTEGPAFPTLEVYDPALDLWGVKADMLVARANFATCVINGKILAIGGGQSFFWDPIILIEEYDPINDTWTHKTDMPRARMGLTASLVNGKIYIIGGADANEVSFSEVDVYDPATNTWTRAADLPVPRFNLATVIINDKIYVLGGHNGPPWYGLSLVDEYDPAKDTWTTKAELNIGRKYLSACELNGKIYVIGGSKGHSTASDYLSSVEEYDPSLNTWIEKPDIPIVLAGPSAISFNNKIYVTGGCFQRPPTSNTVVSTVYEYDPTSGPTSLEIYKKYVNPLGDSLTVHAQLCPEEPPVTVHAIFKGDLMGTQDSIELFDDGLHSDGDPNDNVWAGTKCFSDSQEDFYSVKVFVTKQISGTRHQYPFKEMFTTAGPLTVDALTYSAFLKFTYAVKPFIKNGGSTAPISGVLVKASSDDPWIKQVYPGSRSCPTISPGEIKSVSQDFMVDYDSATFPGYFNLKIEMSVNGIPYWTDSSIAVVTRIGEKLLLPSVISLEQNYPNPFNPATKVKYSIPKEAQVILKVYDLLGNEIITLVNEQKPAGTYDITWHAANLPSGVYFYQFKVGDFIQTKKMILLK